MYTSLLFAGTEYDLWAQWQRLEYLALNSCWLDETLWKKDIYNLPSVMAVVTTRQDCLESSMIYFVRWEKILLSNSTAEHQLAGYREPTLSLTIYASALGDSPITVRLRSRREELRWSSFICASPRS